MDCLRIFKELNKKEVKYVVMGGVALNLYGVVRFTGDLDLILDMSKKNFLKAVSVFKRLGFTAKKKRRAGAEEEKITVFPFVKRPHNTIEIFEILGREAFFTYKNIKENIKVLVSQDNKIKVPLISIDDFIRLKKAVIISSGRGERKKLKDKNDLKLLKRTKEIMSKR